MSLDTARGFCSHLDQGLQLPELRLGPAQFGMEEGGLSFGFFWHVEPAQVSETREGGSEWSDQFIADFAMHE